MEKEEADDWIIMIDESVEFGNHKLLLILGVRESHIDFSRPLNYSDVFCLKLLASDSWTGEQIRVIINDLTLEIGEIKYAVADMGNAIKKSLQLDSIPHVHDINHKFSWFIKQLLKDDDEFKAYCKKLAHLRGSMPLSKLAYLLPPQQRVNSRYMNLKPIFDWGMSVLNAIELGRLSVLEKEKLVPIVAQHKKLIQQIAELIRISNKAQEIVKTNGLSEKTKRECMLLFAENTEDRIVRFKAMIDMYFCETQSIVKSTDKILCSSDILESSFGKYKNYISKNKSVGITDLSLSIPAFCGKRKNEDIRHAMEKIKTKKIKEWSESYLGESITSKRNKVLKVG